MNYVCKKCKESKPISSFKVRHTKWNDTYTRNFVCNFCKEQPLVREVKFLDGRTDAVIENYFFIRQLRHTSRISDVKQLKYPHSNWLLGCDIETAKQHIESLFKPGMSWKNRGNTGWHIDHKIPLGSAKTKLAAIKLCHYTNLQPLWVEEHKKKGLKIL